MNGKTSTLIAAIVIGFLTGVALATKLGGWAAWVFGPLSGGLVGYLAYEFKAVLAAIPEAYREVTSWQPNWTAIKEGAKKVLLLPITILVIGLNAIPILAWAFNSDHGSLINGLKSPGGYEVATIMCALLGATMIMAIQSFGHDFGNSPKLNTSRQKRLMLMFNPLAVFIYWPIRLLIYVAMSIPEIAKAIGLFLWHLFRLIHSQSRLIAGIWALIGVVSWLTTDAFFVCGLSAVLGGIVSRELIGKRILKLIPLHNPA